MVSEVTIVLVCGVYALLVYEIMTHLLAKTQTKKAGKKASSTSSSSSSNYRPQRISQPQVIRKRNSLDTIWRRMRQASETLELNGIKHDKVTSAMAEARRLEREKIAAARIVDFVDDT